MLQIGSVAVYKQTYFTKIVNLSAFIALINNFLLIIMTTQFMTVVCS